ncbi:alpha/beta fold hydrolase [Saccharospirillum salsuginis]|uniref:Hydrolase n=1 Tax=Saccharospirillum salsuginis TaxID=418750 RepID=A0A918NAV3_9GAMM|nr:alpha/beta hydrolase [Saccharospirillum salsuginis]GGX54457.1 hydrolase [Saccharospirillum salsuginis]
MIFPSGSRHWVVYCLLPILIAAWQVARASTEEDITVNRLTTTQGTIAYELQGSGPLVLLLPGLGDLRQSYRFLAPKLAEAGYRVASVDLPGHGDSGTDWPDYQTATVAEGMLALLDELGAESATVVGNSFSAGVATWMATERPERVNRIVMIGPFVRDYGKPPLMMRMTMGVLFNGPWKVRSWAWYHSTLFTGATPADYEAYQRDLKANLSEPGRFQAVKAMIDRNDAAVERRLDQVKQPSLVIMGSKDPDYDDAKAEAEWISQRLNGEMAMIDGAGHYPQAERPEETFAILRDFLNTADRAD